MSELRATAPKVTVRPATRNRFTALPINGTRKRRVAAYARVSTDSDEQFTSYVAQVSYYTEYIKGRVDWEFVEVYSDEGLSGTNTKYREGFNRMIEDALAGKIDLIVTKSVSRFARNTVDSLTIIRKLKEKGVEVYFEKENIYSFDSKGELLLTIMSSLAQEESRSISENVTWGQRKRFADGKVSMPYKHFLGYRKGENGEPEIVEEEAKIIRWIYQLFLYGKTPCGICQILDEHKIPTPTGKNKWNPGTVQRILTNEKYKGDALLQKTFCTDFLTKKMKVNEGEVPQYYVENSHPAIIAPQVFADVQEEIARRRNAGRYHRGTSIFAGKLKCGCCGEYFGSKTWHSTDKYRKEIWRCNLKYKGAEKCATPHVTESEIHEQFVKAYNKLLDERSFIFEDCQMLIDMLSDNAVLEKELVDCEAEMAVVEKLAQQMIRENASRSTDQEEYNTRYAALVNRHQKAQSTHNRLKKTLADQNARVLQVKQFLKDIENGNVINEFSEQLWISMVEEVTITNDKSWTFKFRGGTEIMV